MKKCLHFLLFFSCSCRSSFVFKFLSFFFFFLIFFSPYFMLTLALIPYKKDFFFCPLFHLDRSFTGEASPSRLYFLPLVQALRASLLLFSSPHLFHSFQESLLLLLPFLFYTLFRPYGQVFFSFHHHIFFTRFRKVFYFFCPFFSSPYSSVTFFCSRFFTKPYWPLTGKPSYFVLSILHLIDPLR